MVDVSQDELETNVVMDAMDGGAGAIGRPPDMANRAAVLTATSELLAEVGYADMTIDAVAKRAGLYRNLIYRTWSNKLLLVREALLGDIPNLATPDYGDLRSDLEEIIAQQTSVVCHPAYVRGIPGLMTAMMGDRALRSDTFNLFARPVVERFDQAIERADKRGEITDAPDGRMLLLTLGGLCLLYTSPSPRDATLSRMPSSA